MKRWDPSYSGGNVNWRSHCGDSLIKTKQRAATRRCSPVLGTRPEKHAGWKAAGTQCSPQHVQNNTTWRWPKRHPQRRRQRARGSHVQSGYHWATERINECRVQQHRWTQRLLLSELKSVPEREISRYLLHSESKKKWYKWTCLQNRNTLTNLEKKLTVTSGEGCEGRDS